MISIITLSDKIIINKSKNDISDYISEKLFKNNFRIRSRQVLSLSSDLSEIDIKEGEIYIFLAQKNTLISNKLCKLFNVSLYEDNYIKKEISEYFKQINEPIDSETIKSWQIPQTARAIVNPCSKFQGYLFDKNNSLFFVLPLDIYSAQSMFENSVLPYLLENKSEKYKSNVIRTFGLSENNITNIIKPEISNKYKISVNVFSNGLCNDIVIKAKETNNSLDIITREVYSKLEKFIYSVTDSNLNDIFEKLLFDRDIKISFVEIVSDGILINSLSQQIKQNNVMISYVTSNKDFLKKLFHLDNDTATNIAEETYDIATNALSMTNSDLVIVTNGTVNQGRAETYIALGDRNKIDIYKNNFTGTKQEILNNIKNSTLFYTIKKIKENNFVFFNK